MGVGEEIVADSDSTIDGNKAVQHGVSADGDAFVNEAVRANVGVGADARGFGDDRGGVNAGGVGGRLVEEFDGAGEIEIGIGGAERSEWGETGSAFDADIAFDEDGGGLSFAEQWVVVAGGGGR